MKSQTGSNELRENSARTERSGNTTDCQSSDKSESEGLDRAFLEDTDSELEILATQQLDFSNLSKEDRDVDCFMMEFEEANQDQSNDQYCQSEPDNSDNSEPMEEQEDPNEVVYGPLNFGAYVPVLEPDDKRLEAPVINLSSIILTNEQLEVLSLGLQF